MATCRRCGRTLTAGSFSIVAGESQCLEGECDKTSALIVGATKGVLAEGGGSGASVNAVPTPPISGRQWVRPRDESVEGVEDGDDWGTVVMEPGRTFFRGGIVFHENETIEEYPPGRVEACLARPFHRGVTIGMGQKDVYVGSDEFAFPVQHGNKFLPFLGRGPNDLRRPIESRRVESWDDWERCVHRLYYYQLREAPEESPLVVSLDPLVPAEERRRMVEVLFDTFMVPVLLFVWKPEVVVDFLGLFGRHGALVLDIGSDTTTACVVGQDGQLIPDSVVRCDRIGTEQVAHRLLDRLTSTREVELGGFAPKCAVLGNIGLCNRLVYHCSCVADGSVTVSIPPEVGGAGPSEITLSEADRLDPVSEVLFASAVSLPSSGDDRDAPEGSSGDARDPYQLSSLPAVVEACISRVGRLEHPSLNLNPQAAPLGCELLSNIVVIGGGVCFSGLGERLERGIVEHCGVASSSVAVTVVDDPDTSYYATIRLAKQVMDATQQVMEQTEGVPFPGTSLELYNEIGLQPGDENVVAVPLLPRKTQLIKAAGKR
jgi:Actin